MPTAPPKPCTVIGCRKMAPRGQGRCDEHHREARRERDERVGSAASRGYDYQWRRRREAHLAAEPLCRMCKANGLVVAATVADHIVPHRGDRALFLGELQSLCVHCHSSVKQREEIAMQRAGRRPS